jgi:hypothetical protein
MSGHGAHEHAVPIAARDYPVPKVTGSFKLDAQTLFSSIDVPPLPCDKNHILVACFPKSGSSWLSEIFAQLPEYWFAHLVPLRELREQELAFERLLYYHGYNYVAHLHCRRSRVTERYLEIFSIKPVVLVRNIFDCVVSMKEFIDRGQKMGDQPAYRVALPFAHIPLDYFRWPERKRFDFVIDMVVPWYFNFFIGWCGFSGAKFISYEKLRSRPEEVIKSVSDRFSLGLDQRMIDAALDRAAQVPTRKNRAEVGRGEMLSGVQRDKVYQFARYYPTHDFSMIGL